MQAPENTIPALEFAVKQGADGIEIDIRRTLDGHFVLYHDDWLPDTLGPLVKIEDLTLAEARRLDVGSRWGKRWKGLRVPLLKDVLRFAKQNQLLLFYDIKTQGIDDELRQMTLEAGVGRQVIVPERLADPTREKIPFWSGWGYLKGGEEDPAQMAAVVKEIGTQRTRLMADDCRALAAALGRKPAARPFFRFIETKLPASSVLAGDLQSSDVPALRRALWSQARQPVAIRWPRVRDLAINAANPRVRMDAAWALGSSREQSDTALLLKIGMEPLSPTPKDHPSGVDYFDTFRLATAAGALAKQATPTADAAMQQIAAQGGFAPTAVALGYAALGSGPQVLYHLGNTAEPNENALTFALSYAARHPYGFGIYRLGLFSSGYNRRIAIFGLAGLEKANTRRMIALSRERDPKVRSAVELINRWR